MNIQGFLKTSLLDYPSKICSVIFTSGCNFACPFCHNSDLIEFGKESLFNEDEVIKHLEKRKNVIDGLCITGGEPLLQKDIKSFIKKVKEIGILVKLDTNGYMPDKLEDLMNENLLDYVAMDIKNSPNKYSITTGTTIDMKNIYKSIDLIKKSNVDYEFRTTLIREYHTKDDILKIGEIIKGSKNYYLQKFRLNEGVLNKSLSSHTNEELMEFEQIAKEYVENVKIRGI